jgi:nucleotide-binding universal stress UspA family protein
LPTCSDWMRTMESEVTDVDAYCPPVVVGVDGSHAALNAAQWAVTEAISRGTVLRLVYAQGPADHGSTVTSRASRALEAAYAAVSADSRAIDVQTACLVGRAEQVLVEESKDASMVCIGAGGRFGAPLGPLASALGHHAQCSVAIIREGQDQRAGVISVVLDDAPDNDAVVHQAMREGRMRHATVRQIDRRVNSWVRRFPDVHVETVAAGCGPHCAHEPESAVPQLAVVGRADAQRIGELVSPNCHPIVGYPECSVLLVGGR